MPKYRVYFTQVIDVGVEVEADDPEAAIEAAVDDAPAGLCVSCTGYRADWFRDDAGELEAESVVDLSDPDQSEVWTSPERWRRVRENH